ncbi:Dihydrolipoyllysine-residue acetyltransferase component of acetoin cleaving system [Acaryochloris thomasi RCC1774]|uniref:Dihydrolipoyllysine-residue acetyltransferase component of acetoin cleaving system n=2 Tax=Acaryochloris TaxID=155977 RepID=A0A2W1JAD7_9CYAN|nr:Dihydrolipoyllysine-residue acetyltransferase component of acetoin cleaving system [Acaryochloris thomasi RCC1774]
MDNVGDAFIQWGDEGEVLVFLHYFGGAASSWQWVAEKLQPDHRCVALNLPGFGGAPVLHQLSLQQYADAVQSQLQQLGVESYTLIGHSMGGKVALQMSANQATGLQRVILIAPSPATQEPMPSEEKKRLLGNHPSRENAETTIESAAKQSLSEEQREVAIATHITVDSSVWRWWLLEGMDHSIADQMSQIQVPITVIASKDDPVIPCQTIQRDVIDLIENAQLITTENVGHLMPLEQPEFVATQIRHVVGT